MHDEATRLFNTELVDCLAIAQRDYLLATRYAMMEQADTGKSAPA